MNASRHSGFRPLLAGFCLLLTAATLSAGPTNTPPTTAKSAGPSTNAYVSVFDPKGRNPFFPNIASEITAPGVPGGEDQPAVLLALKGFSGPPNRRFAIINDRTFGVGDESDVIIPGGGRIRIRCVEIRADVAVVTIGRTGDRIELKLPTRY